MSSTPSHRASRVSLVIVGALFSSAWGCAHLPKTGTEATGERLSVDVHTETHTYTQQAKVGEVVNRDSSGRVVGTSEVYENRTGYYDVTRWQVFQGDMPIDDQDFFRIGGDEVTAREIEASRQSGVTMNRVGLGLLIGGAAAAFSGFVLGNVIKSDEPTSGTSPLIYVGSLGFILAGVGGTVTWLGYAKAKREHPIDDPARAKRVAKRYNKKLAPVPTPFGAQAQDDDEEERQPRKKKKRVSGGDDDE